MEFHCPTTPPSALKDRLRKASGQSSVEFVGLIPVFVLCAAIALQALAIGGTLVCAEVAAADASRVASGAQAKPAALNKEANVALPQPWRGGATARMDGKELLVSVRIPQVIPLPKRLQRIQTTGVVA